jgi:hypothetical protein
VPSRQEQEREFLTTVSGWLVSLPHDLKVLFEAKDEPNLERTARETAAGAILYILSPEPGENEEFVGFADDTILVRAALRAIHDNGGEGAPAFRERFPEFFDELQEHLDLCKEVMGEPMFNWLSGKVETLPKQVYKGKKVPAYIDDDESVETLYEDGLAFATDFPIDEDKLAMRVKKAETILGAMRKKLAAEEKKKIA